MNKIPTVRFEEHQLINYLREYGPKFRKGYLPSKESEITAAIWVKRFFEAKYGRIFQIAFELKEELEKAMRAFNANATSQIDELFRKHTETKTLIDFALVDPVSRNKVYPNNRTGFGFQVKTPKIEYTSFEENLAKEINKYFLKYPKVSQDISLVVLPEISSNLHLKRKIKLEKLKKLIDFNKCPFEKVFLLTGANKNFNLAEVYPKLKTLHL